ncbi:MAG TPA: rhomboid family intramembrane serine protease [Mycobacterium sp.]|nr:rhomboid family intramembrane serine protease [Mycobacterium sp.]
MSTPYPPPGPPPGDPNAYPPPVPTCYRHPDRPTYIGCTRCGRPICPECMRNAAVGHQCPDCAQAGAAATAARPVRTIFGGRQTGGTPVVTYALIAINVVMFVLQSSSATLERDFVLWPPGVAAGEWWRIFTSAFLHYSVMHILFNMWALWIVGPPLERWLGKSRFVALYLLSALGGGVLVYLLAALNSATAGASGAIFGLFGATFVIGRRLNLDVRGVVALIVINLAFTFVVPMLSSQNISWQGHIGGLLTGMLVAWVYAYTSHGRNRNAVQIGVTGGLVVLFVLLVWYRTHMLLALLAG